MNSFPFQQVPPTPKKSNKTWIIVAVVLLILCCLCSLIGGVAGYFYFQNNTSGIGEVFNKSTQTPQPNEVNPGEVIRSEEGGYSFTMIPDYRINSFMQLAGDITLDPKDKVIVIIGDGPEINITGGVNSKNFSLEEFAKRGNDIVISHYKATSSDAQQVSVAGLNGIAYNYDYEIPDIGKMKYREIYVIVNPNQLFNIECHSRAGDWDKTLADFEAVTNSVTFFEPVPSATKEP
jgi:hypothetical protein